MSPCSRAAAPIALMLAGCAFTMVPTAPDPFPSRLAAGCHTKATCDALMAEADARGGRCVSDPNGDNCATLIVERTEAAKLQSRQEDVDREGQVLESQRAQTQVADDSELHEEADDLATKRKSQVASLLYDLDWAFKQRPPSLAEVEDPASYRAQVPQTQLLIDQLRGDDADVAKHSQERLDAWAADWERAITGELTCRATPECMAQRVLGRLCVAVRDRRDAIADIATERRNPSGVVDLVLLHDLGGRVQDDDATIRELRKKFSTIARRPPNESCPKGQ